MRHWKALTRDRQLACNGWTISQLHLSLGPVSQPLLASSGGEKLEIMNMGNSLETFVTEGKRIEVTEEKLGLNKVVFIFVFRIRQVCP